MCQLYPKQGGFSENKTQNCRVTQQAHFHPKELKAGSQTEIGTLVFIAALVTIAQGANKPMSIRDELKQNLVCPYNGILFNLENEESPQQDYSK
jgi:hypothetical protein